MPLDGFTKQQSYPGQQASLVLLSLDQLSFISRNLRRKSPVNFLWVCDTVLKVFCSQIHTQTRRLLGGVHLPPTKVFQWVTASVNETIVKPCVTAVVGHKTILNHAWLQRPIRIRRIFPT